MLGIYTRDLQEKLNYEVLQDDENDFIKLFDATVNEYLMNRGNNLLNSFLVLAKDKYLDIHGKENGLFRKDNETDDDFRKRIIDKITTVQSTKDLENLNVTLWVHKQDVDKKNTLTSRNKYLKGLHDYNYIFIGTCDDIDSIKEKFILDKILWL